MKSKNISSFSFQPALIDKVRDIIKTRNTTKICPDGEMSVKLTKIDEDIFLRLIFQNFNQSLVNGELHNCLKQAEIIPVLEKEEKIDKFKHIPISFYQ